MEKQTTPTLHTTPWLAERLGLSVTTIERLRAQNAYDLPPHVTIGRSVRYDEAVVDQWLLERMRAGSQGQVRVVPIHEEASDHE
jgi:predicted DNA-binding transcriptional regulator AlpA